MYANHPLLKEPQPNASLWRYMDFVKFFAVLETRSLFFSRLTSLEDPFEGHPPRAVVQAFSAIPDGLSEQERMQRIAVIENNIRLFSNSRNAISVSCWHANDTESAAMWNLYLKSGEGIAIRTTFDRFKSSFFTQKGPEVSGGLVQYVDYETYEPNDVNVLVWAVLKRLSFSHENEFRGLVLGVGGPGGIAVPVDIETLVADVYVSPVTPNWMVDLLRSMMKRYGLEKEIIRSDLNSPPAYYDTHMPPQV